MFTVPITLHSGIPPLPTIELVEAVAGVSTGSSLNVNLSATPQDNDFLLWLGVAGSTFSASLNTPSGFSDYTFGGTSGSLDGDSTNFLLQPFGRLASSEPGTSYTLDRGTTSDAMAGILSVWRGTGEDDGSPTNWSTSGPSGSSNNPSFSTIQTGGNDRDVEIVVMMVNNGGAGSVGVLTPPTGFTAVGSGIGWDSTGTSGPVGTFDRFLVAYYCQYDQLPSSPPFAPTLGLTTSAAGLRIQTRLAQSA